MAMTMTETAPAFATNFDGYTCIGDKITGTLEGFDLTAEIHYDESSKPSDNEFYDVNDPEHGEESRRIIEAWERDEWDYVGVVVTASLAGHPLGSSSIWGLERNYPGGDNSWLGECANEWANDAVAEARKGLSVFAAAAARVTNVTTSPLDIIVPSD